MFWILIYFWLIAQKMTEVNVSLNNLEPMECSLNDEPQNEASVNDDEEAEEDEDGNPFEAKKRKKTSEVWQEFKVVTLKDGVTKAECIHFFFTLMSFNLVLDFFYVVVVMFYGRFLKFYVCMNNVKQLIII